MDLLNRIPHDLRWRYHRLNVSLDGTAEPEIDNVGQISNMREATIQQLDSSQLNIICSTLLASSFYFELTRDFTLDS